MENMKITSADQYAQAKEQLKKMFNQDACLVNMNEANDLMKAMDCYEIKQAKLKSTISLTKLA